MIRKPLTYIMLLLVILNLSLFAEDVKETSNVSEKVQKKPDFIKISDVPALASKVINELNEISNALEEKKEILEIHTSLPSYVESIKVILQDPLNEHLAYISIAELSKKENEWNVYLNQFEKWNEMLNNRIKLFEAKKEILENHLQIWNTTRKNANKALAPEAILGQITKVIINIDTLRKDAKKRYDILLTDSNNINTKILSLQELLKKTKEAKSIVSSKLFYQNKLPLSTLFVEKPFTPVKYIVSVYTMLTQKLQVFTVYYKDNLDKLLIFSFISVIILLFAGIFNYLYRKNKLFIYEESYSKKKYFFILRPISSTLILILLVNIMMFNDIPEMAKQLQLLLLLIPIFRIFQTLVEKEALKYVYIFFILFFLSIIERYASESELVARMFSIFLTLSLSIYLIYLIKSKVLYSIIKASIVKFVYKFLYLFIALLVVSIVADIYGATLLSSRITNGIFITIYTSILFYVLSILLTGYLIIVLRRRISTAQQKMKSFTNSVEKNMTFFIKLVMFLWWFLIVTKSVGVYNNLIDIKNNAMNLSWEIGSSTISVLSIFDFIVIIAGTWFLVKLVNVILEVEVFSRFTFARGIPTTITTVVNYTIVISGTFIALSSLGITSEQFTLVLGALGVGIGFGLRNIIANFVSGIIMVFERPIQIGDTVEINTTMGTVQSIGTRSSTLKTFDGSEVIIPNADFISKEITNWTLSDERRRKTLLFKVALGSDIRKVLQIMDTVVMAHPNVLKGPEPISTFLGFGDYYLEFKLYFWLHENLIMAQSDIAINIYEMLQKEGIEMPMPKQEFLKHETN